MTKLVIIYSLVYGRNKISLRLSTCLCLVAHMLLFPKKYSNMLEEIQGESIESTQTSPTNRRELNDLIGILMTALAGCCCRCADQRCIRRCHRRSSHIPEAVSGEKFVISRVNSKTEFIGPKATKSQRFVRKFSGTVEFAGQPEKSRVTINIDGIQSDGYA